MKKEAQHARFIGILANSGMLSFTDSGDNIRKIHTTGFSPIFHLSFNNKRGRGKPESLGVWVTCRILKANQALSIARRMNNTDFSLLIQRARNRFIGLLIMGFLESLIISIRLQLCRFKKLTAKLRHSSLVSKNYAMNGSNEVICAIVRYTLPPSLKLGI